MLSISTFIESMTAVGVRDGDMCGENDAPPYTFVVAGSLVVVGPVSAQM